MSEQEQRVFVIEKIYVKDLSLEIPGAPQIFSERESPQISINLHNEARALDAVLYEVVLTATITAKVQEKTAFLVEVAQAGLFRIGNFPPQDLEAVLGIHCGNVLFPYVREVVSSVVGRAGFPPFLLDHVSFETLYEQQRLRQQQDAQQQQAQPPSAPPG
jgi:preprotein translocase subunit SecB